MTFVCGQHLQQMQHFKFFSSSVLRSLLMDQKRSSNLSSSAAKCLKRLHSTDVSDPVKQRKADSTSRQNDGAPSSPKDDTTAGTRIQQAINSQERKICHRPWEMTKKGKTFYSSSSHGESSDMVCEFSVASYNVLAQNLLEENNYLYRNCDKKYLMWNYRKQVLLTELKRQSPDILCLQEVNEEHFHDFFRPQLESLGYDCAYKKRTGKRKDGCATFYKKDKFDCQLVYPVEYLMPEVPLLDRDNVALVVLLQPKRDGRSDAAAAAGASTLCIANTHLLFNPRRGDIKLAQLMILFAVIDKLVYKTSSSSSATTDLAYHPVVICGDFNMEPYSDLYNFVRGGSLDCDQTTIIRRLSGQEPENSRGSDKRLDAEFLGKAARITDQCQYVETAQQRMESDQQQNDQSVGSGEETVDGVQAAAAAAVYPANLSQGSGKITHRLGLRSVYEHVRRPCRETTDSEREATTYHSNACCTVDYVFYSSAGKRAKKWHNGVKHSGGIHLELMSRLRLLSTEEMKEVGELPNSVNASDHTMLMAKFSFRVV